MINKDQEILNNIKEVIKIQGYDGHWNSDSYMLGVYNGMEMIRSLIECDEPNFRDRPEKWVVEIEGRRPIAETKDIK